MLFEQTYNNIDDLFRYCDATVVSKKKDTKFIFLNRINRAILHTIN